MSSWNDIVLGLCLVLAVGLLWMEWRRVSRARLIWRCVATVLVVGALACLGLPIYYWREGARVGDERVLLTEGYEPDSVREFLRVHPGMRVEMADTAIEAGRQWQVFGYGLRKEEWDRLRPETIAMHMRLWPSGVMEVDWKRRLERGDSLVVSGRWRGRPGKLLLMGFGKVLDSVRVGEGTNKLPGAEFTVPGEFALGTVPAPIGRVVYQLVSVVDQDTVAREEVPVEVGAGRPLHLLLLATSPDFENRFLLKWLGENGHMVASRTTVSRGKTQEAFVNRGSLLLSPLRSSLLGGMDLVIADAAALPGKGSAEWGALRREIRERGMGLLLRVDSAGRDSMVRVMKGGVGKVLLRDSLGHVVAGAMIEGKGKVVFTSLNTSYSRLLAGEKEEYAAWWARLLREGRAVAGEEWSWDPSLPRVGEEVRVRLQTNARSPQAIVGAPPGPGIVVYLAQNPALPFLWQGNYWPERVGWQLVYRPMGDTAWWYAWPAGAWRDVYRQRRMQETSYYRGARRDEGAADQRRERVKVSISKVWFWGLFMLGAVFLWVERKMGGMNG